MVASRATEAATSARPNAPPADIRATAGRAGWSVDHASGCWIWNANPQFGEVLRLVYGRCASDGITEGTALYQWHGRGEVSSYEGYLKNGRPHGRGTQRHPAGAEYTGDFKNGRRDGRGLMTWPNGNRYAGAFSEGWPHGDGVFIGEGRERYHGQYVEGRWHGFGVHTRRNGDSYMGEFAQNKYHGQGVFVEIEGARYDGEFKNGAQEGHGSWRFPDGSSYDGEFVAGLPHGYGEAVLDGVPIVGVWTSGCIRGVFNAAVGKSIADCR